MKQLYRILSLGALSLALVILVGCEGEDVGGAPQNFTLTASSDGLEVILDWEEPADGQPDNYIVYFEEVGTTDWLIGATLDGDVLTYTHDPMEMTGRYYVAADFGGTEYESDVETTIPVNTSIMTLGELNAVDYAGYGWDITTDFMGTTYSMVESASIPLVDFYLSNWDPGIGTTPYGIWAPDQAVSDPGNLGGVPTGAWRTTAVGADLISDPQAALPEHTQLNYAQYVDMDQFPAYVAIYTVDGYYALLHVPSQPNISEGTVNIESWFQTVEGLRLIAH
jgi:hypothetical protein